jgi:hypothetical protein
MTLLYRAIDYMHLVIYVLCKYNYFRLSSKLMILAREMFISTHIVIADLGGDSLVVMFL